MSEEHDHAHPQRIRFTIVFQPTWWGWQQRLTIVGIGSSFDEGRLVISKEGGGVAIINYSRVRFTIGEEIDALHH